MPRSTSPMPWKILVEPIAVHAAPDGGSWSYTGVAAYDGIRRGTISHSYSVVEKPALPTFSTRSCSERCALTRYAAAPSAVACSTSRSWPRFDSTMIGMPAVAASCLSAFRTSNPWSLGMTTSRSTRSGRCARATRNASSPSIAVSTSNPCWRNRASAARRRKRSSSARRIRRAPSAMLAVQHAPDQLAQLLKRQIGLHEVPGNPQSGDLGDVLLTGGVGENEHGHAARRLVASERPQHLQARQLRHQHVEQNDVRPLAQGEAEPLLAVRSGRHCQPALPKARLAGPPKEPIILDQQDPLSRRLHGRHPLVGSAKMNVDPRPSSDSHQTWPASFSMMRRTR